MMDFLIGCGFVLVALVLGALFIDIAADVVSSIMARRRRQGR